MFVNPNNLTSTTSKIKDIEVSGCKGVLPQRIVDDLYNGMLNNKTIQDAKAKADYEKEWSARNEINFHAFSEEQREDNITFLEVSKILGKYLGVDYNRVSCRDGEIHDFEDISINDGTNIVVKRKYINSCVYYF